MDTPARREAFAREVADVATMPTCVTITAVGVALASVLYAARRRELRQRVTIERQRDELGALNTDLERRVQEQVAEIVAHAAEVEQLNAQLRAQVRARSSELSLALARLAHQRRQGDTVLRGTTLGGRFVVGDVIGEGGMGAVYEGVDQATSAPRAWRESDVTLPAMGNDNSRRTEARRANR